MKAQAQELMHQLINIAIETGSLTGLTTVFTAGLKKPSDLIWKTTGYSGLILGAIDLALQSTLRGEDVTRSHWRNIVIDSWDRFFDFGGTWAFYLQFESFFIAELYAAQVSNAAMAGILISTALLALVTNPKNRTALIKALYKLCDKELPPYPTRDNLQKITDVIFEGLMGLAIGRGLGARLEQIITPAEHYNPPYYDNPVFTALRFTTAGIHAGISGVNAWRVSPLPDPNLPVTIPYKKYGWPSYMRSLIGLLLMAVVVEMICNAPSPINVTLAVDYVLLLFLTVTVVLLKNQLAQKRTLRTFPSLEQEPPRDRDNRIAERITSAQVREIARQSVFFTAVGSGKKEETLNNILRNPKPLTLTV